ncbi:MAG: NAD(P)-binding protein [Paludibacteraceae bacterium]
MKYAIIGGGVSGLSVAKILKAQNQEVTVYEKYGRPGGMIKCDRIDGCLFHRTGGHVFNTKRKDVLDWFWGNFDKENEFTKTIRNASVVMPDGKNVPYPIENHIYLFDEDVQKSFIDDLLSIEKQKGHDPDNFDEFLRGRFGNTLFNLYFQPYNYKVWRRDLSKVPISWLEGKLPMPTVSEMIYNNINHVEERSFVHSSFFYPKTDGSQFIANRLAEGVDVHYNSTVERLSRKNDKWYYDEEEYDRVIFCGNIKQIPSLVANFIEEISEYNDEIEKLEAHGTTSVFCEIEKNPYSWIYLPDRRYDSHRIICTGNFSESNNAEDKMTATVEFTDEISESSILENLEEMPYSPKYLSSHYERYTYPIQSSTTRTLINSIKGVLEPRGFYLLGRFAEWEYYNMDVAIGAALDLTKRMR